jgi:hypothetical protein
MYTTLTTGCSCNMNEIRNPYNNVGRETWKSSSKITGKQPNNIKINLIKTSFVNISFLAFMVADAKS